MKQICYRAYLPLAVLTAALVAGGCSRSSSKGSTAGTGTGNSADQGSGQSSGDGMAAFRTKFPGTAALVATVSGLRQMLKLGQDPMTPTQTQELLTLLVPLGTRASLPQADAKELSKGIDAALTPQQQNDIGSLREERRNSRRGGASNGGQHQNVPEGKVAVNQPGGGAGAGGQGSGGSRAGFSFDQNMAPDTNVFAQGRLHGALQDTISMLQGSKGP